MIFVKIAMKEGIEFGIVQISITFYHKKTFININLINNFRMTWKKIEIKCEICGDRSHPTNDCPQKGSQL